MRITRVAIAVASVLWAGVGSAQGVYVGGAIGAEVVRTTSTRSGGTTYNAGSGEAFAGAIRIGAGITERFGVELEFFRPGEIETSRRAHLPGGIRERGRSTFVPPRPAGEFVTYPSIIGQKTQVRATTTSALLVVRQPLGDRVEMAYLGGVGFSRVVRDTEFDFPRFIRPAGAPIGASSTTRTIQYAAGPVVGVEVLFVLLSAWPGSSERSPLRVSRGGRARRPPLA